MDEGRSKKIADKLKEKLSRDPNNGLLWLKFGIFQYEGLGNPQRAILSFEKAKRLLGDYKNVGLLLGKAYNSAGLFEKAVESIMNDLHRHPSAHGFCILANVYLENEKYSKAKLACKNAIAIDKNYEEAYFLLGEVFKNSSKGEAIKCYKKAIELDNDYQLAWMALGRELTGRKQTIKDGIEALQKAVELDPDDVWARLFLANAFWRIRRLEDADEQYQKAIKKFPDFGDLKRWYKEFLKDTNKGK